jgi:hypothetical protein
MDLKERELTRLSFLMSSLVADPSLSTRLIERMSKDVPQSLEKIVQDLGKRIRAAAGERKPTWTTLHNVAGDLIRSESETDARTIGRLLAAALELAPRSSHERA